jgi:hypothetical protein
MKNDFVCFSLRLANELTNQGFQIINSTINIKHPQYKVFYFKDSPELRKAVKKYKERI